ncbi:MAG: hypothetical protein ACOC9J_00460 [Persicimonas sp.]
MFGYSFGEWFLIGMVVFFLIAIPAGILLYIWLLARRAEKPEESATSGARESALKGLE